MQITSTAQLKKVILDRAKQAIESSQEEVYTIMENVLKQFYAEYTPIMYERTYQLLKSCVKGEIKKDSNSITTTVYFDSGLLNYTSGSSPTGKQVMDAASLGMHGAYGLHMVDGNTEIYPDSVDTIKRYIFPILKSELIKAGIPVK